VGAEDEHPASEVQIARYAMYFIFIARLLRRQVSDKWLRPAQFVVKIASNVNASVPNSLVAPTHIIRQSMGLDSTVDGCMLCFVILNHTRPELRFGRLRVFRVDE
jgi:hypothetical protein